MKKLFIVGVGGLVVLGLFTPVILREARERGVIVTEEKDYPSLLFVGDIMLDRNVARHARTVGKDALFAEVSDLFLRHEVVVGNLEGTLTTNPSVAEQDNTILRFTFNPGFAEVLHDVGVTTVSLANNHALDFGEFGFDDTRHYLGEAGVAVFGSPHNDSHLGALATVGDTQFCFVGYHELFKRDPSTVVEKIKEIEGACDYTALVVHWGVEYEHEPSTSQQELARLFIDAGADLIIGAHPHVVQPVEVYKNVAIFYSLGNFIFDQSWNGDVKRGAMVSVELVGDEQHFTVIPVNTHLEATLANEEVSQAVLADLKLNSPTFVLEK